MRLPRAVRTFITTAFCLWTGLHVSACSSTSLLGKGEKLYTGADLEITAPDDIPDRSDLTHALEKIITPEPNAKFLGLFRLKLWFYNAGIFKESFGEPPVLFSSAAPDRVAARMKTLLENKGYFNATVRYTVHAEAHTANIVYSTALTAPYVIDSVSVTGVRTPLLDSIRTVMPQTLLRPKDPYDLATIRLERERIDAALKDKGYFYFSPEFLFFRADSTAGNRSVDLSVSVKKGIPDDAVRDYTIGDIYLYSGYSLTRDSMSVTSGDTVMIGDVHYVDIDKKFNPPAIIRSVFFKKGRPYNREDHDLTLNRLMNLGVFKFVNVRFERTDSAGTPRLTTHIYLTPQLMKTIRFELQGVSKSNDFVGPVFTSSFQNKNMFAGAELFKFNLETGFEASISTRKAGSSYQAGGTTELVLPQFIAPFRIENVSSRYVPKTRVALGFRLLDRLQYYQLVSGSAEFGYTWKETLSKEHTLNPFSVTIAHVTKRTDQFNELLKANPLLRRSFDEQFIIGSNYSFTYNDQLDESLKNHFYFRGSADFSGNVLNAAQTLLTGTKATPEDPHKLFGTAYSQFSRFDIDVRQYYHSAGGGGALLASRFIAGVGFSYGNSTSLPFVKQFYIAGGNSIRAFNARTLGPGTYQMPDSLAALAFNEQAGDIKLEANLDFRFPIYSFVKGALFLDAGNIWLAHDDPNRPGSQFSTRTFLNEIAVGTGFGVRFDLSFFVIRFDLAWPLRVPSLPSGERWVVDRIKFWNADWAKNNLVLNIAIGYPF